MAAEAQMQDYQDMHSKGHLFMKIRRLPKIIPTCNITVTEFTKILICIKNEK